jgi:hypothetical protein
MSKQDADESVVGWWRKTADDNDVRAQRLEELAYQVFNLDDAGFMLREVKLLREQAKRFREAAAGWKAGDLMPKRAWSVQKAAEVEPEEFRIQVVNDASTQHKALRPIAEGLSESDVRKKLEGWGLAATEIDARIQQAREHPNYRLPRQDRIQQNSSACR